MPLSPKLNIYLFLIIGNTHNSMHTNTDRYRNHSTYRRLRLHSVRRLVRLLPAVALAHEIETEHDLQDLLVEPEVKGITKFGMI